MSNDASNPAGTINGADEIKRIEHENEGLQVQKNSLLTSKKLRELQSAQVDAAANRIVALYEPLSQTTVADVVTKLHTISAAYPGEPITVVVSVGDGHISLALALYDELVSTRERGHELTVVVRGYLDGVHAVLLQAASEGKRIVGPNTFVELAKPSYQMAGDSTQQAEKLELNDRWLACVLDILASRSSVSVAQINSRWANWPWTMDATQLIKHGFADVIG